MCQDLIESIILAIDIYTLSARPSWVEARRTNERGDVVVRKRVSLCVYWNDTACTDWRTPTQEPLWTSEKSMHDDTMRIYIEVVHKTFIAHGPDVGDDQIYKYICWLEESQSVALAYKMGNICINGSMSSSADTRHRVRGDGHRPNISL